MPMCVLPHLYILFSPRITVKFEGDVTYAKLDVSLSEVEDNILDDLRRRGCSKSESKSRKVTKVGVYYKKYSSLSICVFENHSLQ